MPNLVQVIASAAALLTYVPLALLFTMARMDLNPASLKNLTEAHSGVEMYSFSIKAAMVMASVLVTSFQWLSLLLFALAAYHLFLFLYWQPHQQVMVAAVMELAGRAILFLGPRLPINQACCACFLSRHHYPMSTNSRWLTGKCCFHLLVPADY